MPPTIAAMVPPLILESSPSVFVPDADDGAGVFDDLDVLFVPALLPELEFGATVPGSVFLLPLLLLLLLFAGVLVVGVGVFEPFGDGVDGDGAGVGVAGPDDVGVGEFGVADVGAGLDGDGDGDGTGDGVGGRVVGGDVGGAVVGGADVEFSARNRSKLAVGSSCVSSFATRSSGSGNPASPASNER